MFRRQIGGGTTTQNIWTHKKTSLYIISKVMLAEQIRFQYVFTTYQRKNLIFRSHIYYIPKQSFCHPTLQFLLSTENFVKVEPKIFTLPKVEWIFFDIVLCDGLCYNKKQSSCVCSYAPHKMRLDGATHRRFSIATINCAAFAALPPTAVIKTLFWWICVIMFLKHVAF